VPILVPAHPLFGEGVRAERAVWEVLRDQLPDEAVLLRSLRVQERQNEYEADIVVLIPGAGWAVIEVKGGDVRRVDGAWEQRQKGLWQPIDPVGQAQSCRHVLQCYLARHGSSAEHSRAVHMVAVPDCDVGDDIESPGLPRPLLIDRHDLKQAFHKVLQPSTCTVRAAHLCRMPEWPRCFACSPGPTWRRPTYSPFTPNMMSGFGR
jgi:hypothetical protein